MKSSKTYDHEMSLSVRTESGRCSIDLGLDHLTTQERQFVFNSVAATLKGGSAGFGMDTLETGEIVLQITLAGPKAKKKTVRAVKAALNG